MSPRGWREETLSVLERGPGYRLGVLRTIEGDGPYEQLEVLLLLLRPYEPIDLAKLQGTLDVLQRLDLDGFEVKAEDGGWVSCVRRLSDRESKRKEQLEAVRGALSSLER